MASISFSGMSASSPVESYSDEQIEKKIAELQDGLRGVPSAILQSMKTKINTTDIISLAQEAGATHVVTILEKLDSNKPEDLRILFSAIERAREKNLPATEAKDSGIKT